MRWLILLAASLFLGNVMAREPEPLSKEARELLAWFDRLGLEDTSKAKFVRIRTGGSVILNGKHRQDEAVLGWLLEDTGAEFRAVRADLSVGVYTKGGKREEDADYVGYGEISLEKEARGLVEALKNPEYFAQWREASYFHDQERLSRPAQIFLIARACAQRQMTPLAGELIRALEANPKWDGRNRRKQKIGDELEQAMAYALYWRFELAFRKPGVSWAELAEAWRKIVEDVPREKEKRAADEHDIFNKESAFAKKMIEGLRKNAKEETEDARRGAVELDKLPEPERVKELVRRLRDEVDEKQDEWGWPDAEKPRGSNGAMDGLRALGMSAAPALLAEMRSGRPSRSAHLSMHHGEHIMLFDTRDLAASVLNDIAGLNFRYVSDYARSKAEDQWTIMAKVVEEWMTAVQTTGEKQWLIDHINAGGENAEWYLPRLREKYPEASAEILIAGASKNKDPRARAAIVQMLWKDKDARAEEFLRKELKEGPTLANQVAAAYGLRQRGDPEAETAIVAEWRKVIADPKAKHGTWSEPGEANGVPLPGGGGAPAAESSYHALNFMAGA